MSYLHIADSPGLSDIMAQVRAQAISAGWVSDMYTTGKWCFHDAAGKAFFSWTIADGREGIDYTYFGGGYNPPAGSRYYLYGNTGFDGSKSYHNQPGSSLGLTNSNSEWMTSIVPGALGNIEVWSFVTSTYIHVVMLAAGIYTHLQVGTLDKKGLVYEGGQYTQGSCGSFIWNVDQGLTLWPNTPQQTSFHPRTELRIPVMDGFTQPWSNLGYGLGAGAYANHFDAPLAQSSANDFTGDTIVVPNRILHGTWSNARQRYMGETPDFGIVSMQFCDPGDILIYNAEEWQVFPALFKSNLMTQDVRMGTSMVGYAYKLRR